LQHKIKKSPPTGELVFHFVFICLQHRFTTERSFKKVDRFFKTPKATNIAFKLNFTLLLCRFGTAKVQRNFHFL